MVVSASQEWPAKSYGFVVAHFEAGGVQMTGEHKFRYSCVHPIAFTLLQVKAIGCTQLYIQFRNIHELREGPAVFFRQSSTP